MSSIQRSEIDWPTLSANAIIIHKFRIHKFRPGIEGRILRRLVNRARGRVGLDMRQAARDVGVLFLECGTGLECGADGRAESAEKEKGSGRLTHT